MLAHPLDGGIRINQIRRWLTFGRCPGGNITSLEPGLRQLLSRSLQHGFGIVDTDHIGAGKTLHQKLGGVARPAAQIHDAEAASG